jgi:hypothetical protein
MKNNDIVCDCNDVTVADVLHYLKTPANANKPLEDKLTDLDIATACRQCKETDCDRIDVHYSEIVK